MVSENDILRMEKLLSNLEDLKKKQISLEAQIQSLEAQIQSLEKDYDFSNINEDLIKSEINEVEDLFKGII